MISVRLRPGSLVLITISNESENYILGLDSSKKSFICYVYLSSSYSWNILYPWVLIKLTIKIQAIALINLNGRNLLKLFSFVRDIEK